MACTYISICYVRRLIRAMSTCWLGRIAVLVAVRQSSSTSDCMVHNNKPFCGTPYGQDEGHDGVPEWPLKVNTGYEKRHSLVSFLFLGVLT